MDAASFVVNLVDKVTGPARQASSAIAKLEAQITRTGRVGASIGDTGPISPKALAAMNRANLMTFAKARIGVPVITRFDVAVSGLTDSFISLGKYGVAAIGAAGVAAGTMLVKGTMHAANFAETTMVAFTSLTGGAAMASQAWQKTIALSKQLGMGFEETANSMKHLLAMQFSLGEAEELIKISSDLQAVTGDAQATERALRAITQIKAKGRLQSEELVGQLAEAGVSTVLVYEELGKILGKDTQAVRKLITAGKVDSDLGITAIKRAILRKTHSTEAGTAGTAFAQTTFTGLMAQLKNAPQFLFLRLAEQVKANLDKFRPAVKRIIDAIDGIQGDQMARFVGNVLQFAERLVPLALEFAAGFGEGFSAINEAMGNVDPSVASMKTARELGKAIADGFKLALDVLKKIMDVMIWIDNNRGWAMAIGGAFAALKVTGGIVGAIGTVKAAGALLGVGGAAAGTAGATAATTAAATTVAAATAGVGTAAVAGGTTAAIGTAAAVGASAAIASGVGAVLAGGAIGYYFREELAKWMYGTRADQTQQRGLVAYDAMNATPTAALQNLQRASNRQTNNNVTLQTTVNIEGAEKDANQLGKDIAESHRDSMEQFFQSQALEAGAM